MNLSSLMALRKEGKRPANIINLSLCGAGKLKEPLIVVGHNMDNQDFRSLHGLAVDIHYWQRKDDAVRLAKLVQACHPHSLYAVNHKQQICLMLSWQGKQIMEDQTFLYDWRHTPYE